MVPLLLFYGTWEATVVSDSVPGTQQALKGYLLNWIEMKPAKLLWITTKTPLDKSFPFFKLTLSPYKITDKNQTTFAVPSHSRDYIYFGISFLKKIQEIWTQTWLWRSSSSTHRLFKAEPDYSKKWRFGNFVVCVIVNVSQKEQFRLKIIWGPALFSFAQYPSS